MPIYLCGKVYAVSKINYKKHVLLYLPDDWNNYDNVKCSNLF